MRSHTREGVPAPTETAAEADIPTYPNTRPLWLALSGQKAINAEQEGAPNHPEPSGQTHFHTMAFSLALYLAFPFMQITCTPLVFRGVGILT